MIVTVTPLKLDGHLVWEARIAGFPSKRSFLRDHAVGMLVCDHPDLFHVEFENARLSE